MSILNQLKLIPDRQQRLLGWRRFVETPNASEECLSYVKNNLSVANLDFIVELCLAMPSDFTLPNNELLGFVGFMREAEINGIESDFLRATKKMVGKRVDVVEEIYLRFVIECEPCDILEQCLYLFPDFRIEISNLHLLGVKRYVGGERGGKVWSNVLSAGVVEAPPESDSRVRQYVSYALGVFGDKSWWSRVSIPVRAELFKGVFVISCVQLDRELVEDCLRFGCETLHDSNDGLCFGGIVKTGIDAIGPEIDKYAPWMRGVLERELRGASIRYPNSQVFAVVYSFLANGEYFEDLESSFGNGKLAVWRKFFESRLGS